MADSGKLSAKARVDITQVRTLLSELQAELSKTNIQDAVSKRAIRRIKNRTKQGRDVQGRKFTELSPATIQRRKRRRKNRVGTSGGGPLVHFGNLIESIQVARGQLATGSRFNTGFGFRIGALAEDSGFLYGSVHNTGNERIPQREFMGFSGSDIASIERMLTRLLNGDRIRP